MKAGVVGAAHTATARIRLEEQQVADFGGALWSQFFHADRRRDRRPASWPRGPVVVVAVAGVPCINGRLGGEAQAGCSGGSTDADFARQLACWAQQGLFFLFRGAVYDGRARGGFRCAAGETVARYQKP